MGINYSLAILTLSSLLSAQPPLFILQTQFSAGVYPVSLAVGDFTADARLDLIVADQGSATLAVFRGIGDGFFQPLNNQATGLGPRVLATGDFNRDGRLDLAVANFSSNTVSILLGIGFGVFASAPNLLAAGPSAIAVGDFNSDGRLDLAIAEANSNTIALYLGSGVGTFPIVFRFTVGARPVSLAVSDFNADGILDLAVANSNSGNVSILLGIGNGIFFPILNFVAGDVPTYVAVGDFNGDGKPDLAIADTTGFATGEVNVLLGMGKGFFVPFLGFPVGSNNFPVGTNPLFIAVADFNLDGKLDLAVANRGSNTISVLQGLGNGIFLPQQFFTVGSGPAWIGVADLNSDGKPDLLVANSLSNTVSTLINRTPFTQPVPLVDSVVNAASLQSGSVAAGEMVTIFGNALGPNQPASAQLTSSGGVSTALAQTRVFFGSVTAPLIKVSASQVTAMVPYSVAGSSKTALVIENNGISSQAVTLSVAESAPALFTANGSGVGPAAALNENGSLNSITNPASKGSIVVLYGTGFGQTDPQGVDGQLATAPPSRSVLPVSVSCDGKEAQVVYAGAAPGLVAGVTQMNFRLPNGIRSGAVSVEVHVGNGASQSGVTLSVQ